MVTVTICLYILALAGSVSAIPIEDDPHYFNRQIASDMTGIAETLYAKRRTSSFDTIAPCFSMSKHQALGIAFLYNVSYLFPHRVLNTFTTRLTTVGTPPHTVPNVVNFKVLRDGPRIRFKIMYINPSKTCFILIKDSPTRERQCLLLQTRSTVDREPPSDCQAIYRQHCNRCSFDVYYHSCQSVLVSNIGKQGTRMFFPPGLLNFLGKKKPCK
ncbi:uncharacterized protein LOC119432593 isoform X1 [Dermacentor silvarum]|uniref:uncharacterized protein LOC119432593 isoform X1 n=1 Tax=Dermacentor silvarum TaxID=543639 RepID=UPI00189A6829|nr:uncharacterized protein LOC119432593 isoform X1 [Dermacentor silvarum]